MVVGEGGCIIYKYYIPERVIVKNVILRNMIINRGEASNVAFGSMGILYGNFK